MRPSNRRGTQPPRLVAVNGRVPPHALEAEAAVLSACMLKQDAIDQVVGVVRPVDFFGDAHQVLFAAILLLRAEKAEIDSVTVAHRLRQDGTLARAGGLAYLAHIVDATPAVANVRQHAEIVASKARRRRMIRTAEEIMAEGYDESEGYELGAVQKIADAASLSSSRANVLQAWRTLPPALLDSPPAPQPWLLRHPTLDGDECAPGRGDGLLPLGKAGLLSSAGGTGKTMALIQLAVSVITGRPWFGQFHVADEARGGRVVLGLAEESEEDVHRRIYPAALSLDLTAEERALVLERLIVLPLAGRPVALLGQAMDGSVAETEELYAFRAMLRRSAQVPFSLVVLDPLARWAGPDVEADNAVATRFVQTVESLTEARGTPTVLVSHHSSKTARRTDTADSRGVTALTDGFRWHATMRSNRGNVLFTQAKSNYSIPMLEEITLARRRSGVLSVQTTDEVEREAYEVEARQGDREAAKIDAVERRIASAENKLLSAIARAHTPPTTRAQTISLVPGRKSDLEAALTRLVASQRVEKSPEGFVIKGATNEG